MEECRVRRFMRVLCVLFTDFHVRVLRLIVFNFNILLIFLNHLPHTSSIVFDGVSKRWYNFENKLRTLRD